MIGRNKIGVIICFFSLSFLFLASESQCQYGFPYTPYNGYWQVQNNQPHQNFSNTFIGDIKPDYFVWDVEDNYQFYFLDFYQNSLLHNNVFNYAYTFEWGKSQDYYSQMNKFTDRMNFIPEINYGDIFTPYNDNHYHYSGFPDVYNYQFYFLDFYKNLFNPHNKSSSPEVIPALITVDPNNITLYYIGQTQQMTITALYSDMTVKTLSSDKDGITYISSDPNVATVDNNGLVTALKDGTIVVTSLYEDLSESIEVVVSIIHEMIQFLDASPIQPSTSPFTVKADEEFTLGFMVIPENINFFFSCNVGTISEIADDVFLYSFKTRYQGYYLIQITGYSEVGAETREFVLHVLPWWYTSG